MCFEYIQPNSLCRVLDTGSEFKSGTRGQCRKRAALLNFIKLYVFNKF